MKLARDTWLIFSRHMLLMAREPLAIAFGMAYPLTYLLLFAPLLKVALHAGSYAQAYLVYVPGLLVLMALTGGLFTGFGLLAEIQAGIVERARVTPVSRTALVLGRALREVATIMIQAMLVTVLAVSFGLATPVTDLLLAYLLLALVSLMAVSFSYGATLRLRDAANLGPVLNTVSQPVMLLSGVLLPLTLAPLWMLRVAHGNPFYWAANGMRALFAGHAGASAVWESLLLVAVLAVAATIWSARTFAHSIA